MQGYQLTFITQQHRKKNHKPLAEWLLDEAQNLGIKGATMFSAAEGFGRDGKIHSAGFFDLADQPIEVTMAVTDEDAELLFVHLNNECVNVFYIKAPIEFGMSADR